MATADLARAVVGRRAVTRTPVDPSTGVLSCACTERCPGYDAGMRSAARLLPTLALSLLLAACTGGASLPSKPADSASPAAVASTAARTAQPSASAAAAARTAAPSRPAPVASTPTAWGTILDAVPSAFPVFPDATVADPPADGPVSGAWVTKAPVAEVATWYRDALLGANYAKVDLGSALEDGSRVLDVQGDLPECRAQVTVKPLGQSTLIAVLYGAGCGGGNG